MKAIILAAGEGSRLRPLTNDQPKCLVEMDGKTLLNWQIDVFKQCNILDIIVVTGYMHHMVNRDDIRIYVNESYKATNMVYSFFCAEREFTTDIIVSYADIIFNADVLKALLKDKNDFSIIVDMDWESYWRKRFENPLSDAETLKLKANGQITNIGQKPESKIEIDGQFIGLMKFTDKGITNIRKSYENAQELETKGENVWAQSKPLKKVFMTDLLQGLILEGCQLNAVKISGGWLEIDSVKDYTLAKKLVNNGVINRDLA